MRMIGHSSLSWPLASHSLELCKGARGSAFARGLALNCSSQGIRRYPKPSGCRLQTNIPLTSSSAFVSKIMQLKCQVRLTRTVLDLRRKVRAAARCLDAMSKANVEAELRIKALQEGLDCFDIEVIKDVHLASEAYDIVVSRHQRLSHLRHLDSLIHLFAIKMPDGNLSSSAVVNMIIDIRATLFESLLLT
ncbi:hypothetical protein BCR37DRAFT_262618 [Protomyces lactucae-debilis]|uniref:Uncharacterized protein n=1 Tax=Protomyces lactucae-debilis TaxID=2754530 RepID=A0A1Y2FM21_PROLT|nr:uncharacterized protein BCR37DRAFT_262618 [Protomyces lactucae-debilis]ORY84266.1 hypothetical protein BCR37DRAFT_262618 [Protomyces lactucae-debilis]